MLVKGDAYAVLLSLGMLARIRVMSRILLSYWGADSFVKTIRSPLDKVPSDRDSIPVLLQPLILDEDQPDFWERILELDQCITLQPLAENDVQELVHAAMLFILSHEFAHILHGHFDLLRRAGEEDFSLPFAEIHRGLELDADDGGAAIGMRIMLEAIKDGENQGHNVRLDLGWLRLAYAVSMVFAITDTHRNYFGDYEDGAYNHPMVRCELFLNSARRSIDATEAGMQMWDVNSAEGWRRCVMALENFSADALTGKFGKLAEGVTPGPLHTLSYSATTLGATDQETLRMCSEGFKLMWRVRKLLPIFANISDAIPEDPFMQKK